MYAGPIRTRSAWAAVLAIAVLTVATAAVVPGPWHEGLSNRSCDLCRSGHLPTVAPLVRVEVQAPLDVEWRVPAADQRPGRDPVSRSGSPRAPPA